MQGGLRMSAKQQSALVATRRTMLANIGFLLAERRRLLPKEEVTLPLSPAFLIRLCGLHNDLHERKCC